MEVNFSISGKIVLITGAAGVLCSEMAVQLAKKGAHVAVLDIFYDKALVPCQS